MERILILANNDLGLYKFRKELIQELINKGNRVYISLPNGEFVKPLTELGCEFVNTNIDRRGINPISDLFLLISYLRLFKTIKPDKVITYTIKPNVYGGLASRLLNLTYITNITGLGTAFQKNGYLKKIITFLYKISLKKSKIVFFENEDNRLTFVNNKIVKRENTFKLNGAGVNLEEYNFCEYPENNEDIRFLFIGRIMKEKGVEELFEVAKLIKGEYQKIHFDIIGPLEEDYEYIINDLQKNDIINYYGYQKDVKSFIKRSHCLILPSYHEGMANTLLESAAMGRPLITSNINGCKEAVIEDINGFLVNIKDVKDLYIKVKRFIEAPYINKQKFGENSRKIIEENFDKNIVVSKTIEKIFRF